jgi:aryl-alcohol dehydrogenase-like predicted oxidoreductase
MNRVSFGGLDVPAQGLGCMGISEWYGAADWDQSIATIHRALELGVTFLDTADIYGAGHNEVLVGRAIAGSRDDVQLATKFGIDRTAGDGASVIRAPGPRRRRGAETGVRPAQRAAETGIRQGRIDQASPPTVPTPAAATSSSR